MQQKTKKIIKISVAAFIVLQIFLCIFYSKLFVFYLTNVMEVPYLYAVPKISNDINNKTTNTSNQNIGLANANFKIGKIKKVKEISDLAVNIEYEKYSIRVHKWEEINPDGGLSFSKHNEIASTTPHDAKILNSPGVNITVFINLILKGIMMTSDSINIYEFGRLGVISQDSKAKEKNVSQISIYDKVNNYAQSVYIVTKDNSVNLSNISESFINSLSASNSNIPFNEVVSKLKFQLEQHQS